MEYQKLTQTIFSYGSPCNGQYGHLVLREDGSVYGYSHPNEHSWAIKNNQLLFQSLSGAITSRYTVCADSGVWQGHSEGQKWPLYLMPLLTNSRRNVDVADNKAPVFLVNSIPKSGTYYLEAVLDEIGYPSERIHLVGNDNVDDYRDMPDDQLHVAPASVRLRCPVDLVAAILQGQHIVGHIEHRHIIDKMRALDICVLTVIRNLRDVLMSLYHFKLNTVLPLDTADRMWRKLEGRARLHAFLVYYHDKDLQHIRLIAEMIANDNNPMLLRYEELCQGVVSSAVTEKLEQLNPGMARQFLDALKNQYGQPTPTRRPSDISRTDVWDDSVEQYFIDSGMDALNRALGY